MTTSQVTQRHGFRKPVPERNLSQWNRVEPLQDPAFWLVDGLRDVNALEALEVGWDGSDAGPPAKPVVELARRLVVAGAMNVRNLPAPHIGPVPGGGIQLEWHVRGKDLELEILPDTTILTLQTAGAEQLASDINFEREENAVVLMAWLIR